MIRLLRVFRYSANIVRSLAYDLRYALSDRLRLRAGTSNHAAYRAQLIFPDFLKFGAALDAVRPLATKFCHGRGLDVGAGHWPLEGARAIEDGVDENAYLLNEPDSSLDYLFSSHTLEHLERPWEAITEWTRVLRPGGILFLYLPHPACDMWKAQHLRFHIWNPDPVTLEDKLTQHFGYELAYVTYLPDAFFSFVIVARKKV